jgi:hypothetical protein
LLDKFSLYLNKKNILDSTLDSLMLKIREIKCKVLDICYLFSDKFVELINIQALKSTFSKK